MPVTCGDFVAMSHHDRTSNTSTNAATVLDRVHVLAAAAPRGMVDGDEPFSAEVVARVSSLAMELVDIAERDGGGIPGLDAELATALRGLSDALCFYGHDTASEHVDDVLDISYGYRPLLAGRQ